MDSPTVVKQPLRKVSMGHMISTAAAAAKLGVGPSSLTCVSGCLLDAWQRDKGRLWWDPVVVSLAADLKQQAQGRLGAYRAVEAALLTLKR